MIERLLPPTQKREWILKLDSRDLASKAICWRTSYYIFYRSASLNIWNIGKGRHVNQTAGNVNAVNGVSTESIEELRDAEKNENLEQYNCTCQRHVIDEIERVKSHLERIEQVSNVSKNLPIQSITDQIKPNRWCWIHKGCGHSIDSCGQFKTLTDDEKLSSLRQTGACFKPSAN